MFFCFAYRLYLKADEISSNFLRMSMSKRMIFYVAGIVPESKSSYSVYVPDFPEITSGGQSVQEAFFNANQALHDAIAERVKQKHSLPPARIVDEVRAAVLRIR